MKEAQQPVLCDRQPNKRLDADVAYTHNQLSQMGLTVVGKFDGPKTNHVTLWLSEGDPVQMSVVQQVVRREDGSWETRFHPTNAEHIMMVAQQPDEPLPELGQG